MSLTDVDSLMERIRPLTDCREPLLIGVRHHSAALARAMGTLLDSYQPEALLVELPGDMQEWMPFLADEDTIAPVALSAVGTDGRLFFYPFADFSPELVAIRWASRNAVPVTACDLPTSVSHSLESDDLKLSKGDADFEPSTSPLKLLMEQTQSEDSGQLWERLVETPGVVVDAETLRRTALIFGWAVRLSDDADDRRDGLREAAMRRALRLSPRRSAVVIGSFHAPALVPEALARMEAHDEKAWKACTQRESPAISLVPYEFAQLDERSGYPAGIRDPAWYQKIVESESFHSMEAICAEMATRICRALRERGHLAGTPDAAEIVRMAKDLARLRRLPMPGRSEFLEAVQSSIVQGELYGRGRAVARASGDVMIGHRRGAVVSTTPRCGLEIDVGQLLDELSLPGAKSFGAEAKEFRLDVLRNRRDRARAVVLRRLAAAGIGYATRVDSAEREDRENLIERWTIKWGQGTSAQVAAAARHGVTLVQVVTAIAQGVGALDQEEDSAPRILNRLRLAADCGLPKLVDTTLSQIDDSFLASATFSQLISTLTWYGRIVAGHVLGLPVDEKLSLPPILMPYSIPSSRLSNGPLLRAALDRLEGMEGSDRREDVAGLVDLVCWIKGDLASILQDAGHETTSFDIGSDRLRQWCRRTIDRGSHRMSGAAAGVLASLGDWSTTSFATLTEGWFVSAVSSEGRCRLRFGLAGAIDVILASAQQETSWLDGLEACFLRVSDSEFLEKLPSLRGGFSELSPADRERLLDIRIATYDERGSRIRRDAAAKEGAVAEVDWARWRAADLAGRSALNERFPQWLENGEEDDDEGDSVKRRENPPGEISIADRWRLVLGNSVLGSSIAKRAAHSLDELYGHDRGEGAENSLLYPHGSGGPPLPTPIEWTEDLEGLFGTDVCQEILGEASGQGNAAALEALNPDDVQPSIELLRQVLSLAGGMAPSRAQHLRRLAKAITRQLASQLANRIRPSLTGLSTPRPTSRRTRKLHVAQTIRRNLARAYRRDDGKTSLVVEKLIYQSFSKREMDWHLTFVVDVSGSMNASVVYSALVAAVFAELPAVSVRFLAISTEVIDLSDHCADPLSLLLEVRVGGGTHIGLGLRAARAGITHPSQSIVVLLSDFEEGVSVGEMIGEVRALVRSGVRCLGLASLDDSGIARFHQGLAQTVAQAGMPVAALSPEHLARWIGERIRDEIGGTRG